MDAMTIQGTTIQIKEYKGKRVVTFKDIDDVHQRPLGTASRNFRTNRERFISGVDFYAVDVTDNEFRRQFGVAKNAGRTVTLITESGYLMLVKSFTDDLAWKVQRELVDSYFRARAEPDENTMRKVLESGVPTLVIDTDKLIRCAEIMAGCLDGNRAYVLNILRQIIPDVDNETEGTAEVQFPNGDVKTVPDVSEKIVLTTKKRIPKTGCNHSFNRDALREILLERNLTQKQLQGMIGCCDGMVSKWMNGTKPTVYYRERICEVLGLPDGYFDKRTRRKSNKGGGIR